MARTSDQRFFITAAAERRYPDTSISSVSSSPTPVDVDGCSCGCTVCIEDETPLFSVMDILCVMFSIAAYLVDVGLDCFVAYKHYLGLHIHPLYFYLSLTFIVMPSVVASAFSLSFYVIDYKKCKNEKRVNLTLPETVTLCTALRIVLCMTVMATVARHVDTLRHGLKLRSKQLSCATKKHYFVKMKYERLDGAMLGLVEAFLEAAPQLLLQIYIIFREGLYPEATDDQILSFGTLGFSSNIVGNLTLVSIFISMGSLAWSIVAYHRALRLARDDRKNISITGSFLSFLWRLFEVAPRVIIFAMFMYAFEFYLAVVLGVHWAIMFLWIYRMKTNFCQSQTCEPAYVMLMAAFWIICFFNLKDGHTRGTALIYYTIFYLENIGLTAGWLVETWSRTIWYRELLCTVILGSFWIAVVIMIVYYKCEHPETIQACLPISEWWSCKCSHDSVRDNVNSSETDGPRADNITESLIGAEPKTPGQTSASNNYSSAPAGLLDPDGSDDASHLPFLPRQGPTPELQVLSGPAAEEESVF